MMATEGESGPRKSWNVTDLLKHNHPRPQMPQIVKNLEKAKQNEVSKNPSVEFGYDDEEVLRVYHQPRPETESRSVLNAQPPLAPLKSNRLFVKKELQPILQKPKNSDNFAATGERLAKLELLCKHQREEIKSKSQLIEKLYQEATLNKMKYEQETTTLKEENMKLKEKIELLMKCLEVPNLDELEQEEKDNSKENSAKKSEKPVYVELPATSPVKEEKSFARGRLPKEIDIKLIKKRIEDLNDLIDGETDIVKDRGGAYKFKRRDRLTFAVYKDGIKIEGYQFYKYSEKEAQEILEDILDGYFPAILKDKYPEGTPFELVNEVERTVDEVTSNSGKKSKNKAHSERDNHFKTSNHGSAEKNKQMSSKPKELSVDKLQESIVEITTSQYKKEAHNGLVSNESSLVTMKIRTETGKKTLILKASTSDKIATIYDLLHEYSETKNFEIWGGYPPQAYSNNEEKCLEDLGISGESVFNLRSKA